jgi:hypothetical protein
MAETFNMLGVPAVFLDRGGHILFLSTPAEHHLTGGLAVQSSHLLAQTRDDNALLASFVADVLQDPAGPRSVALPGCRLTLTALAVPGVVPPVDQLLHAIIMVGTTPAT